MGKISKEQRLYMEAMEHALDVAKDKGIEELEKEVRYRSSNPLPLNVSRTDMVSVARGMAMDELMFLATASATTLSECMKMPPSVVLDYLKNFNDLVEIYRNDKDRFDRDQDKLNRNYAMNETCKLFLKEDNKDESK